MWKSARAGVDIVQRTVKQMKNPAIAAALTGVEIVGTAVAFGAAETLLAVAVAYAVYRLAADQLRGESASPPKSTSAKSTT